MLLRFSKLLFAVMVVLITSCQSSSYEDFHENGRAKTRSLVAELRKIRTRDQLIENEAEIESALLDLALLLKRVENYQRLHPDAAPPALTAADHELSDELRVEILRIFRLDGGREVINRCRDKVQQSKQV